MVLLAYNLGSQVDREMEMSRVLKITKNMSKWTQVCKDVQTSTYKKICKWPSCIQQSTMIVSGKSTIRCGTLFIQTYAHNRISITWNNCQHPFSPPVNGSKDPWPRVLSLPGAWVVCWRPHPAGTYKTFHFYNLKRSQFIFQIFILWIWYDPHLIYFGWPSKVKLFLRGYEYQGDWLRLERFWLRGREHCTLETLVSFEFNPRESYCPPMVRTVF